jgi:hypothetical protein
VGRLFSVGVVVLIKTHTRERSDGLRNHEEEEEV